MMGLIDLIHVTMTLNLKQPLICFNVCCILEQQVNLLISFVLTGFEKISLKDTALAELTEPYILPGL